MNAYQEKRVALTRRFGHPAGKPHSASTYRNWGCRCEGCSAAQAVLNAAAHERRRDLRGGRAVKPITEFLKYRRSLPPSCVVPRDWQYHGTVTGGQEYKCRCDACRKALSERKKLERSRQHVVSHGTDNSYILGCRCGACTDARRDKDRRRFRRRDPAIRVCSTCGDTGHQSRACRPVRSPGGKYGERVIADSDTPQTA